jgi:hypothetical protein
VQKDAYLQAEGKAVVATICRKIFSLDKRISKDEK